MQTGAWDGTVTVLLFLSGESGEPPELSVKAKKRNRSTSSTAFSVLIITGINPKAQK
jgi:hypothetical protein